jgi:methylglutaconyl-CoA hydratase
MVCLECEGFLIMAVLKTIQKNKVLYITLTRPEFHNAMDSEMIVQLTKTFKKVKNDKSILAVVLAGDGPSFCAGGDLNWMRESLKYNLAKNTRDAQTLSNMYETIFQCPIPVLGYVHGNVMGGGVGLAAVCDIVTAETNTKFCLSEVRLGLVPSIIAPYVLKKIPEGLARPLFLTAEVFKADHAEKANLIHFVGSEEHCQNFIVNKLNLIVNNGPEATRIAKDLIHKVVISNWSSARKLTVSTIAKRRVSKEGQEGMNAFFEKRDPSWR